MLNNPQGHLRARLLLAAAALASIASLAGCGGEAASASAASAATQPLLIAPEDVLVVRSTRMAAGPLITGSIQPDRKADLRAEVQAVVMAVLKENGDAVKKGDLLVRLDDTAIRDSLVSAQEAERVGVQAYDQAERQLQRLKTLRESGMASAQALEDAEIRRNATQSDLSAAKARVVQARQQLQRTEVRAPFEGIVAERKASAGDTAQIGKELLKVIDPTSLRFEGLISSDAIQSVGTGQRVGFRVNGYGEREFAGRIRRVSPTANAMTRQVEVLVDIEGEVPARLAGLYAEGRVESSSTNALVVPASAIVREGDRAWVWRIHGGAIQKVALGLGERDTRRGDYVVRTGVTEGDRLLRHPIGTLKDAQAVRETTSASSAATAAASNPAIAR
ncbi:MAG TPA: efflux RND transporter periplasmic adaptor subunit [Ramlibacter sp.]|uniref:efflux RND transporter periplasmic adaptor subunit n=1 Tax=Ramlibacter sp. TaxID=1917967 RepID=UPI002C5A0486|nr:efflux RND transporter periplasmic adaptor subunit [Ramlibacter sp.]HVZ44072.1 efflux RND transporter periplasmic adaptor subunit [Ramlibacter sp.]